MLQLVGVFGLTGYIFSLSESHQKTFPDPNVSHVSTTSHLLAVYSVTALQFRFHNHPSFTVHRDCHKPQSREAVTRPRASGGLAKIMGHPSLQPKKNSWRVGRRRLCN